MMQCRERQKSASKRHMQCSRVKHLADIDVARATYEAACKRWPGERITLRQEARVIEDSRKARVTRLHE